MINKLIIFIIIFYLSACANNKNSYQQNHNKPNQVEVKNQKNIFKRDFYEENTRPNFSSNINVNSEIVINNLFKNDFTTLNQTTAELVSFYNINYPEIEIINIYGLLGLTNIRAITIAVEFSESINNKNNIALKKDTLLTLQKIFATLPCSKDNLFLTNGFVCKNQYQVTYSVYEEKLDKIRKIFGFEPSKKLVITIN